MAEETMKERVKGIEIMIKNIHEEIVGNGKPGLIRQVKANTKMRYMILGVGTTLGSVGVIFIINKIIGG